jgi:hypothetical protein
LNQTFSSLNPSSTNVEAEESTSTCLIKKSLYLLRLD